MYALDVGGLAAMGRARQGQFIVVEGKCRRRPRPQQWYRLDKFEGGTSQNGPGGVTPNLDDAPLLDDRDVNPMDTFDDSSPPDQHSKIAHK